MQQARLLRSGYGSVGRAVASDTRGPQFESSNQAKFYTEHVLRLTVEKMKKVTGNDPFLNKPNYFKLYCFFLIQNGQCSASFSFCVFYKLSVNKCFK